MIELVENIKKHMGSIYSSESEPKSIIFSFNDKYYLAISSSETYPIDNSHLLFQNILLEVKKNVKINSNPSGSPFYLKNIENQKLSKKIQGNLCLSYIPTGKIIEIDDLSIVFSNIMHLSKVFLNKTMTKSDSYSILLSKVLDIEIKKILPHPTTFINLNT